MVNYQANIEEICDKLSQKLTFSKFKIQILNIAVVKYIFYIITMNIYKQARDIVQALQLYMDKALGYDVDFIENVL